MARKSKTEMLETLRQLLREAFVMREAGGAHARLARAQGYADGYMRALMDANLVEQRELLAVVSEERRGVLGPATREVTVDESDASAAA
jgi:hypothetical protein